MSNEAKDQEGTNTEEQQSSEASSTQSKEDHLLEQKRTANAEAKDYRIKFEALQQKVEGIEKAKNEAELDATEKLKIRDQELTTLKAGIEQDKLTVQYVDMVKGKGFTEKIAKLGVPKDLTADTLLDSVKKFDKDYAEFKEVKKQETSTTSSLTSQFSSIQPSKDESEKPKRVTGTNAFKSLYNGK